MKHIHTFESFLFEYQKYSDYKKGSWGSPEDLKEDVTLSVRHLLPVDWKKTEGEIKSVEDQSDDNKGIKFEIRLKSGDSIFAYKTQSTRGSWEWYLNKKKMNPGEIKLALEDKMYTPYEKWMRNYDMIDNTAMYSDDHSVFRSNKDHQEYVDGLYKKLSPADKKKADDHINK